MLVFLFVLACFCIVSYLVGRGSRLNRSIKRGDALVDLESGEVFEPGSKQYNYAKKHGAVKFE